MRSRAAATPTVGDDGLLTFSREIDHIWYAVYSDDKWLYDSQQPGAPQAVKNGDKWSLNFKLSQKLDPTKTWVFFWAGCEDDAITFLDTFLSEKLNLNFKQRCVTADPSYINRDIEGMTLLDSFCGYFQLSTDKGNPDFNLKVTLKRPFAQIHVLTDELTDPGVTGIAHVQDVVVGFARERPHSKPLERVDFRGAPRTWFFDRSISFSGKQYEKDEFMYTGNEYYFYPLNDDLSPRYPVTFKGRSMSYLYCFSFIAPPTKSQLISGYNLNKLININMHVGTGNSQGTFTSASVPIPEDGIKANERYVIYNRKKTGDGDGEAGGGGFLSNSYAIELLNSPSWDNGSEIVK